MVYNINLIKFDIIIKALLHVHKATFHETCLSILLLHKLHESLPSVTCPLINLSRIFFLLPQSLRKVKVGSTLRGMFITGHVTLGNDPCNLCHNGATKLRDKLQEKLSCVPAP